MAKKQEWKEHGGKVLNYDDSSLPRVSFLYSIIPTSDPNAPEYSTKDFKLDGKPIKLEALAKRFGMHQIERIIQGIK